MKTVITFGVFDVLHIGHVKLFKKAKELGDRLIVAVQDDSMIRKFKPGAHSVYTTEERVFMVSSIKYVDQVIVYNDVQSDIKNIKFDIFAKGPDQNHSGFQHAEEWCRDNKKNVIIVPRTEGISSTIIKNGVGNTQLDVEFHKNNTL